MKWIYYVDTVDVLEYFCQCAS